MGAAEAKGGTNPIRRRQAWRWLRTAWRSRRAPVSDPALWRRIEAAALPVSWRSGVFGLMRKLTFVQAVAEDLELTPGRAAEVVKGYRRFLYLCAVTEERLTPSEVVDAVWHLHLTRADKDYDRFCDQVIGAPVAHVPGLSEADSAAGYRRALDRYEEEFGEAAPEPVWPTPATDARVRRAWRRLGIGLALNLLAAFAVGTWFRSFDPEASPFNPAVFLVGVYIAYWFAAFPKVIRKGEGAATCGG